MVASSFHFMVMVFMVMGCSLVWLLATTYAGSENT